MKMTEQEAINQDGEEIMEQANDITRYERFESFYILAITVGLLFLAIKGLVWVVQNSALIIDKYLV